MPRCRARRFRSTRSWRRLVSLPMRRAGFGTDDAIAGKAGEFRILETKEAAQHGVIVFAEGRGRDAYRIRPAFRAQGERRVRESAAEAALRMLPDAARLQMRILDQVVRRSHDARGNAMVLQGLHCCVCAHASRPGADASFEFIFARATSRGCRERWISSPVVTADCNA